MRPAVPGGYRPGQLFAGSGRGQAGLKLQYKTVAVFFQYLGALPFTLLLLFKEACVALVGLDVFHLCLAISALFFVLGLFLGLMSVSAGEDDRFIKG